MDLPRLAVDAQLADRLTVDDDELLAGVRIGGAVATLLRRELEVDERLQLVGARAREDLPQEAGVGRGDGAQRQLEVRLEAGFLDVALVAVFLAAGFLAAVVLAAGFLAAAFFLVAFFAVAFIAVGRFG